MTPEMQVVILVVAVLVALIAVYTLQRNGAFRAAFEWGKARFSFDADGRPAGRPDDGQGAAGGAAGGGNRYFEGATIRDHNRIEIQEGDRVTYGGTGAPAADGGDPARLRTPEPEAEKD
jgi:hypothetical protein